MHGHGGSEHVTATASPAARLGVAVVLVPLVLATVVGMVLFWSSGEGPRVQGAERVDATILEIGPCEGEGPGSECEQARVRIDAGPEEGGEAVVFVPYGVGAPEFEPGDEVVLGSVADAPPDQRYEILDFQRTTPLLILAVSFAVAVVLLSRWRGVAALAGLGYSILVLTVFVLPALLEGHPPLAVAVVGASAIMVGAMYLTHGVSVRTSVALLGTLASLTLTGLIGFAFTTVGRFTGLADESAAYLGVVGDHIDVRGLLLAGLVIGALGVLNDVTVTQTVAVWEVASADPRAGRRALLAAGLRIGREHVGATVNTLVLAYAGASLPLLLLFVVAEQSAVDIVTTELVAQEIVRALAGSLGIVAAVPITTALAALAVQDRAPRRRGRRAARPDPDEPTPAAAWDEV